MPVFKNISNDVFQDGDLVILPGQTVSTDDAARIDQLSGQYGWQFEEVSGKDAKDAPSEADMSDPAHQSVREIRTSGHVVVDANGNQAERVDDKDGGNVADNG